MRTKHTFAAIIFLLFSLTLAVSPQALAEIELGINYAYKKSTFDAENNTESQSTTGSLSFYLWKQIALEFSYTNGLFVKKERPPTAVTPNFQRTTTVYSDIYGADLIYVLADRENAFQPYIKGGVAQIKRRQVVQDDANNPWEIFYSGVSPSYGLGFKFFFTKTLSVRTAYDIIQTPVDGNTKIDDVNGRVGLSWVY